MSEGAGSPFKVNVDFIFSNKRSNQCKHPKIIFHSLGDLAIADKTKHSGIRLELSSSLGLSLHIYNYENIKSTYLIKLLED